MKKTKKIIGISLIVIVILAALFGVLYLKTDVLDFFKKPKTLFYTYLMQNKEGLPEFNYSQALKRAQEESCEEIGTIEWNFELSDNVDEETKIGIDIVNGANIAYNLKSNIKENEFGGDFSFQYEGEELFKLDLILTEDVFGIKIGEIYDKYIVIENNNLKELAEKFGIDSTTIPDKIEFAKTIEFDTLSQEDLKIIKETYASVLDESISEENFTKSKENISVNGEEIKTKAYTITLSQKETQQLIINLLETLKKDDVLLGYFVNNVNKINEANYGEEYEKVKKSDLKIVLTYIISSIEEIEANSSEKLEITVYEAKGKTVRTELKLADASLILDRKQNGNNTKFRLGINENKNEIIAIDFDMIKEKDKNEIKASIEVLDVKIQISFQANKEMTENALELFVKAEEDQFSIKDSTKLEYKQVEIDESVLKDAEIINEKSIEEINSIITKIQENVNKFVE